VRHLKCFRRSFLKIHTILKRVQISKQTIGQNFKFTYPFFSVFECLKILKEPKTPPKPVKAMCVTVVPATNENNKMEIILHSHTENFKLSLNTICQTGISDITL